jgi:hypothetical protein
MGHIHLTDTIETVFATLVNIQIGIASYSCLYMYLSISEKRPKNGSEVEIR